MTSPHDLDIEGREIGPMTSAELKVVREYLGLSGDWLAGHLGVSPRTVRHWEEGKFAVPEGIRTEIAGLEAITAAQVTAYIEACGSQRDPAIRTYRHDTDFDAHVPGNRWPASWHRAVCARVAQEVPGVAIEFWTPDVDGE